MIHGASEILLKVRLVRHHQIQGVTKQKHHTGTARAKIDSLLKILEFSFFKERNAGQSYLIKTEFAHTCDGDISPIVCLTCRM